MGDSNAVDRTEAAHESLLSRFGAAREEDLVGHRCLLPEGDTLEVVYIDDRRVISILPEHFLRSADPSLLDVELVKAEDRAYESGNLMRSEQKGFQFQPRWTTLGTQDDSPSGWVGGARQKERSDAPGRLAALQHSYHPEGDRPVVLWGNGADFFPPTRMPQHPPPVP